MIVIIDHFDSFVHTLARYVREAGWTVEVIRQDDQTGEQILARQPSALIFSPGPGRPENTGVSRALLAQAPPTLPILGVCLGHQLIAEYFGGRVGKHHPCHGMASPIFHDHDPLFSGVSMPFPAGRYHSLIAQELPTSLRVIAWGEEQEIMAIRHVDRPIMGVQFHPESVLTPDGRTIIANFLEEIDLSHPNVNSHPIVNDQDIQPDRASGSCT